jgi:hypothetical protein
MSRSPVADAGGRPSRLPSLLARASPVTYAVPIFFGPQGHWPNIVNHAHQSWVIDQAAALLRKVAPFGMVEPVGMRLTKVSEPGPTISGPVRRGEDRVIHISFDGRTATLVDRGCMRVLGEERRAFKAPVRCAPSDLPPVGPG